MNLLSAGALTTAGRAVLAAHHHRLHRLAGRRATTIFTAMPTSTQCIAADDDTLGVWVQDPTPLNLTLSTGLHGVGFRDPQAWHDGSGWTMVLGSGIEGVGGAVLLYRSVDFHDWRFQRVLYVFESREPGGETCECPDFFHSMATGVMSLPKLLSMGDDGRLRIDALPELRMLDGRIFHDGAHGEASTPMAR